MSNAEPHADDTRVEPHEDDEFIITALGEERPSKGELVRAVPNLPALFYEHDFARELLVRSASVVHGARRALNPVNVYKARHEARKELKRLRRARKNEVKEALREYRARHGAHGGDAPGKEED